MSAISPYTYRYKLKLLRLKMSNKLTLDAEPLLPASYSNSSEEIDELSLPKEEPRQQPVKFHRFVPLELVMLLYFCAFIITIPVTQFYIYSRVAERYGIKNVVQNDQSDCIENNNNSNKVLNSIQEDSAQEYLFLSFASTFPAIIPCLFLGSISDRYGRKVALLIPMFGLLVKQIISVTVFQLKGPIGYLYIGGAIEGCSGYFGSSLMACFSMLADITTPGKQRALRIAILEGVVAISLGLTMLGTGFWINYSGFIIPMVSSTVMTVFVVSLIIALIPETRQIRDQKRKVFSLKYIIRCFSFYFQDNIEKRRKKLIASVLILLFSVATLLAKSNVQTLFLLNKPFCWTTVHITSFSAVQTVANWGTALGVMILLQKVLNLQDFNFLILGTLSGIGCNVLFGFAYEDWMIYLYVLIGVFSVIVVPMTRSIMSRVCSPEEQGALFAGIGSVEMLVTAMAGIMYSLVYKETVSFFPGIVFLIMAFIMVLALISAIPLFYWVRSETRIVETLVVSNPEEDE